MIGLAVVLTVSLALAPLSANQTVNPHLREAFLKGLRDSVTSRAATS